MPDSYYTEKLLGVQEASIKKVNDMKEDYEIFIEQPRKQCVCPACGNVTDKVHDYRTQRIKELSAFEKPVVLVWRKRRYACSRGTPTECGISVDSVIVSFLCSQAKAAPKHRKSVTKRSGVALFLCSSMVPCDSVRFFPPTIDIEPIIIKRTVLQLYLNAVAEAERINYHLIRAAPHYL